MLDGTESQGTERARSTDGAYREGPGELFTWSETERAEGESLANQRCAAPRWWERCALWWGSSPATFKSCLASLLQCTRALKISNPFHESLKTIEEAPPPPLTAATFWERLERVDEWSDGPKECEAIGSRLSFKALTEALQKAERRPWPLPELRHELVHKCSLISAREAAKGYPPASPNASPREGFQRAVIGGKIGGESRTPKLFSEDELVITTSSNEREILKERLAELEAPCAKIEPPEAERFELFLASPRELFRPARGARETQEGLIVQALTERIYAAGKRNRCPQLETALAGELKDPSSSLTTPDELPRCRCIAEAADPARELCSSLCFDEKVDDPENERAERFSERSLLALSKRQREKRLTSISAE